MRVLYVNHTARVSGAERSLLELMSALRQQVEPVLACPDGELSRRATAAGFRTERIEPVEVGYGSGPRELLLAAQGLIRGAARLASLSRRLDVDVVHAASARAGIVAALAALLGGRRPIVDVRDSLPAGPRAAVVRWALRLSARALVFNSKYTRRRFGPTRPAHGMVAYPPVNIVRLLELPLRERRTPDAPVLGVIGQLTPWKGQDDAIRVLAGLRRSFPAVRLRIVGSVVFSGTGVTYDNNAYARGLTALVSELGLSDAVEFVGATEDLPAVLSSLDVLLVPSWEEPFGRVVAEGMAAGVPVVATSRGGPAELIENGRTGFLAPPGGPEAWIEPVAALLEDPELAARIKVAARTRIQTVLGVDGAQPLIRVYREGQATHSVPLIGSVPGSEGSP